MASFELWKKKMILSQTKRNDLTKSNFDLMRSIPKLKLPSTKPKATRDNRSSPLDTAEIRSNSRLTSCCSSARSKDEDPQRKQLRLSPERSFDGSITRRRAPSPAVPFGGGELPMEEKLRKRVKKHPGQQADQYAWSMIVRHNVRLHQQELARKKRMEKQKQMELGRALRKQIEEKKKKAQAAIEERVELAKSMKKSALKYEEEEFQKLLEAKERHERVRDVVKQQLDERRRQRQERLERKEKIERRTTKKIEESIESERKRAVQNRIKRIEEQKRFLAESQIKQKERFKALQKNEEEELRRQTLYAKSTQKEEDRRAALEARHAKVRALELLNSNTQKRTRMKLAEEAERIQRHKEEFERVEAKKALEKELKREHLKQEMVAAVNQQLQEKQKHRQQVEHEKRSFAKEIRKVELTEVEGRTKLEQERRQKMHDYKAALDLQRQNETAAVTQHCQYDSMNSVEKLINRDLIKQCLLEETNTFI